MHLSLYLSQCIAQKLKYACSSVQIHQFFINHFYTCIYKYKFAKYLLKTVQYILSSLLCYYHYSYHNHYHNYYHHSLLPPFLLPSHQSQLSETTQNFTCCPRDAYGNLRDDGPELTAGVCCCDCVGLIRCFLISYLFCFNKCLLIYCIFALY